MKRIKIKHIVTCITILTTILGVCGIACGEILSPEEMNSIKGFACVASCNQEQADCGISINSLVCLGISPCGGTCTSCSSGQAYVTCTGPQNANSCTETTVVCSLATAGTCVKNGPICYCVPGSDEPEGSCGNTKTCQQT